MIILTNHMNIDYHGIKEQTTKIPTPTAQPSPIPTTTIIPTISQFP